MTDGWSKSLRQTSMANSVIGNIYVPQGSISGINRSRRSSWSDAKVIMSMFCFHDELW